MKRKDELKDTGAILPLFCAFLSTGVKTVLTEVVTTPPLPFGELGLRIHFISYTEVQKFPHFFYLLWIRLN